MLCLLLPERDETSGCKKSAQVVNNAWAECIVVMLLDQSITSKLGRVEERQLPVD